MTPTLDALTPGDLEAARELSTAEGWNQTAADWERLLLLAPAGCFAARAGGRLIGTVTAVAHGGALGWIGMMVVHPEQRGRGIGDALMRHALAHLEGMRVGTVGLDATPAGRPLYQRLGFADEVVLERWQGAAAGDAPGPGDDGGDGPRIGGAAPARLRDLDRAASGVDRGELLDRLAAAASGGPLIAEERGGGVAGFAFARPGRLASYIGPLIAADPAVAGRLLDALLARLAGGGACLDRHPGGALASAALAARGFTRHRTLTRMRLGPAPAATRAAWVAAIAGPELG